MVLHVEKLLKRDIWTQIPTGFTSYIISDAGNCGLTAPENH